MLTDERLCQIALSCGFADQSHFTRVYHPGRIEPGFMAPSATEGTDVMRSRCMRRTFWVLRQWFDTQAG